MCRKTTFASSTTVNLAVDLAVAKFNVGKSVGLCNVLEAVTGESAGPRSIAAFTHIDATRQSDSMR